MKNSNIVKLISNFGSRIWSLVSVFIFVPLYIHYLGIENYAIIGFYTLILGIISFADAGMSSAVIREFSHDNTALYKYSVLRKVENLYWTICFCISLILIFSSNLIAEKWLHTENIPIKKLAYFIKLIGIGVPIQLVSSLYYGALFGLNEQVRANSYQILWNIARAALVIILFIVFKPSLEIYFIWQIICNSIYIIALRFSIIRILSQTENKLNNILDGIPKSILNYVGGMTLIAVISAVNSQADKIITSSFFTLKIYGFYNIASLLAQIPVIIATPLTMFVFPLFSKFSSKEDNNEKLNICFEKISFILNMLIFPAVILLIIYAKEIILLWAGKSIDVAILPDIVFVLRMLSVGSLFLALQFPFFYLLLSKGKTKYTIYQGVVQILIGIPLLYFCAKHYGIRGIGLPWILINLGSFTYLCIICFSKYINLNYKKFFIYYILVPFFITFIVCISIHYLYKVTNEQYFSVYFVFSSILSVFVSILISNKINNKNLFSYKDLYNFPNE